LDGIHVSTFDLITVLKEEIAFTQEKNHVSHGVVEITINDKEYKKFSSVLDHSMQTGKELIKRCFRTMMSEALYFCRTIEDKQPAIRIDITSSYGADGSKMYIISFSNNGRPVRSDNVEDIFDAKLNKGHGAELIGLPSVKALISKLNGTVVLTDRGQKSGWVTFSITIPEML
jgi:signal transduction histidine kinase